MRLPILEANSVRVLCRLLAIKDDPRNGQVRRRLWEAAATLLPTKHVAQFNQALMELGALVCTPSRPACDACPLARRCAARLRGIEQEIPALARQATPTRERHVAVVVRRGPRVLLVQRPAQGRWANFWEFPHTLVANGETDIHAAGRVAAELGLKTTLDGPLTTISHSVTRYRITLVCLLARYRAGRLKPTSHINARWLHGPNRSFSGEFAAAPPRRGGVRTQRAAHAVSGMISAAR